MDPYRPAFDLKHVPSDEDAEVPPHRHLFHCYVYQYHLMQFAQVLIEMVSAVFCTDFELTNIYNGRQLAKMIELEKERKSNKLWTPARTLFSWHSWEVSGHLEHDDDENPGAHATLLHVGSWLNGIHHRDNTRYRPRPNGSRPPHTSRSGRVTPHQPFRVGHESCMPRRCRLLGR